MSSILGNNDAETLDNINNIIQGDDLTNIDDIINVDDISCGKVTVTDAISANDQLTTKLYVDSAVSGVAGTVYMTRTGGDTVEPLNAGDNITTTGELEIDVIKEYDSSTNGVSVETAVFKTANIPTDQVLYCDSSKEVKGTTLTSNLTLTTGTLDTVQDIQTTSTPQFEDLNINNDILPVSDNTSILGSASKRFNDGYFIDENGTQFQIRGLARSQRQLRNNNAILTYDLTDSVTTSVWTVTITDNTGIGVLVFNVNGVVYVHSGPTLSIDATSCAGTDASPKDVYIYVTYSGGLVLNASNTRPDGAVANHVDIAYYKAGTVGVSSITKYAEFDEITIQDEHIHNVHNRFFDQGSIYISGMGQTITSTDATIASGNLKTILSLVPTYEVQVSVDGLFFIASGGTYGTQTDFNFTNYGSGEAIGISKYFNCVIGIVNTNASSSRIMALVGNKPTVEYTSSALAKADSGNTTIYFPSDGALKKLFIPVARLVVQQGGTLQQIDGANYFLDLRGQVSGTGGASGGGITDHGGLTGLTDDDHTQYALLSGRSGNTLLIDDIAEYTASHGVQIDQHLLKDANIYMNNTGTGPYIGSTANGISINTLTGSNTGLTIAPDTDNYATLTLNKGASNRHTRINFQLSGTNQWYLEDVASTGDFKLYNDSLNKDSILVDIATNDVTINDNLVVNTNLSVDLIQEKTTDNGVSVEGVLLKDSVINVDTINEKTTDNGVDIESIHLENGQLSTQSATSPQIFIDSQTVANATLQLNSQTTGSCVIQFQNTDTDKCEIVYFGSSNQYAVRNNSSAVMFYCDCNTTVYADIVNDRPVHIDSSGNLGTTSSLTSHKTNISDISDVSWIYNLKPKVFNRKQKIDTNNFDESLSLPYTEYGLLAEDVVNDHLPLADYDYSFDGETYTKGALYGIKGNQLIYPVVKEIQRRNNSIQVESNGFVKILSAYDNDISGYTNRDLAVTDTGLVGYLPSTKEKKLNIKYSGKYEWVYDLKPVSFNYKDKDGKARKETEYGLIAEDVEKINKELVFYDKNKKLKGVHYRKVMIPLLAVLKEQKNEKNKLIAQIDTLDIKIMQFDKIKTKQDKLIQVLMDQNKLLQTKYLTLQTQINTINTRLALIES